MALRNSISATTGVDLEHWAVGGQFEINTRGSESLPVNCIRDRELIHIDIDTGYNSEQMPQGWTTKARPHPAARFARETMGP